MNRIISIEKISKLNLETLKENEFPNKIYYLDTGNLTRNKIDKLQELNTKVDKIPSRAKRKVKKNTILYSTVRPNQEHYGFIEKDFDRLIVSTGFTTIDIVDKEIDPKYIYYFLTQKNITEYLHMKGMNSVSSYPSISPSDLGSLNFRIPENITDQKKIAKVLSDLDAKIEVNNKINTELESMAKLVYDYWFVQFDFPDENGKPYKSYGGKMIYNEELKREIPDNWKVSRLNTLIDYNSGYSFPSKSYSKSGKWKIITIKAVKENEFDTSKCDMINELPRNLDAECNLKIGDLLMSLTGNTGRLCFVSETNCLLNQRVAKIWSSKLSNYFIYLKFKRPESQKMIEQMSSGSSQANLSLLQLFKAKDIVPDNSILKSFENKIEPIFQKILLNKKENKMLTELRDWLLPMLMNGQVTVK